MIARISHIFFSILLATAAASPALAQEDVRGVKLRDEGPRVIEEKCLACHNRQRIEAAVKERREMDQILRRMGKKGVVLSEKERRVMGHFWGQKMFKSKE
jgi:hypothetical protein